MKFLTGAFNEFDITNDLVKDNDCLSGKTNFIINLPEHLILCYINCFVNMK